MYILFGPPPLPPNFFFKLTHNICWGQDNNLIHIYNRYNCNDQIRGGAASVAQNRTHFCIYKSLGSIPAHKNKTKQQQKSPQIRVISICSSNIYYFYVLRIFRGAGRRWLIPVILGTQEAELRRIEV
jgi:hypothetical protein